jgi:hypothetical protein
MTKFTTRKHQLCRRAGAATAAYDAAAFALPLGLVALLVFLVMTYVIFMNAMTQKSFEIKKLSSAVDNMKRENQRLEVDIAQRESIANLSDRVAALGMVPTDKVDYVTVGSGAVALR